jgi:hypothetical protein
MFQIRAFRQDIVNSKSIEQPIPRTILSKRLPIGYMVSFLAMAVAYDVYVKQFPDGNLMSVKSSFGYLILSVSVEA